MQNVLAFTLATVIVGTLVLAVFSLKTTEQETSVSATQFRASKQQSLDIAAMIQRDFTNIGSNYPNHDLPLDSIFVAVDTVGRQRSFSFRGQASPSAPPSLISYQWFVIGTTDVDSSPVPVFKLTRYVDGVNSGGSTGGIVELELDFQRENGTTVGNIKQTRQIQVDLLFVSSLGVNEITQVARWSAVIRPRALQIESV